MKKDKLKTKGYLKKVSAVYSADLEAYRELDKKESLSKTKKTQKEQLKAKCEANSDLMQIATTCQAAGISDEELEALAGVNGSDALVAELAEVTAERDTLTIDVDALQSEKESLEATVAALETSVSTLEGQLTAANAAPAE